MKTQALEYYMHDEPDAFRFELSGSLSGDGARSVFQAWRTALSILGRRPMIVDISFVDEADQRGSALLRFWHRQGTRIVATSAASYTLAAAAGAAIPAPAEDTSAASASAQKTALKSLLLRACAAWNAACLSRTRKFQNANYKGV